MALKRPPTPNELLVAKRKVIEDPNTKRIAESLGMPFDDYVALVMKYVENPNMEPVLTVVPDDVLRSQGFNPPTRPEIAAKVKEYVENRMITERSKFADPNSQRERVDGAIPVPPPAQAAKEEVRNDLKEELEREVSTGRFKKF
jgi:hypothetical protein